MAKKTRNLCKSVPAKISASKVLQKSMAKIPGKNSWQKFETK